MTLFQALAAVAIAAGAALSCAAATATLIPMLRRRQILDHPNPRSSHVAPTPRGGGLAVIGCVLPLWAILFAFDDTTSLGPWLVLAGAAFLALISWVDDLRGLPALPRFTTQLAAVALGLVALAHRGPIFGGWLPIWLDLGVAALCWLWFVNLFNFMDGIDGIAGTEAACIGFGLFIVLGIAGPISDLGLPAVALAGAALGFLRWNWHPAKVFLGDVGSIPLGYMLGWLLLAAASDGFWQAALVLPLYFLADASLTLMRRLARGAPVWEAHRTHFYQRATQRGLSHSAIVRIILLGNLGLVGLAAVTVGAGSAAHWRMLWPILAAGALVAGILVYFGAGKGRRR